MTTPQNLQPPPYGSDEWYEFMDEPLPDYDDSDLDFDREPADEPHLEVQGAPDGRVLTADHLRVVYHRPRPQLDTSGHPVREITGTITTTAGGTLPVTLYLTNWDPTQPAATAQYTSRPLSATAHADAVLLPVGDGDGLTVQVSSLHADVERFRRERHRAHLVAHRAAADPEGGLPGQHAARSSTAS